jgi:hypothetical protein
MQILSGCASFIVLLRSDTLMRPAVSRRSFWSAGSLSDVKLALIATESGVRIPVRLRQWEGKTFLICTQTRPLLQYLTGRQYANADFESTILKGVVIPEEGSFFQVFDSFGSALHEEIHLTPQETQTRLLDSMIWQVAGI